MTDTVAVRHESQSFLQGRPSGGQAPPFHGGHGIVNLSHRGRLQKSVAGGSGSENAKRACRPAPKSGDRKEERRAEVVNVTMPAEAAAAPAKASQAMARGARIGPATRTGSADLYLARP